VRDPHPATAAARRASVSRESDVAGSAGATVRAVCASRLSGNSGGSDSGTVKAAGCVE